MGTITSRLKLLGTSIAAAISVSAAPPEAPLEREVFLGIPTISYMVSKDGSERREVSTESAAKSVVRIVKIGNDYFWKTRENRKLIYSHLPGTDYYSFTDPIGGGYVKIGRLNTFDKTGAIDKTVVFMEHLISQMYTITYYGPAELPVP